MNAADKNYYHLISGEVVFVNNPDTINESIGSIRLNGILITDIATLPVRSLGKAQQVLQVNFMKQMGAQAPKIVDVVLHNFVLLGHFTKEEFEQPPEGMQVKPKVDPNPEPKVELKLVPTDEVIKDDPRQ